MGDTTAAVPVEIAYGIPGRPLVVRRDRPIRCPLCAWLGLCQPPNEASAELSSLWLLASTMAGSLCEQASSTGGRQRA